MQFKTVLSTIGVIATLSGCSTPPEIQDVDASKKQPIYGDWGVSVENVSTQLAAGDDFYRFVNDGWLKTAEIPEGFSRYGAFTEIQLRTEQQLESIMSDIAGGEWRKSSPEQQLGDLYKSFLDVNQRNAEGLGALNTELDSIMATQSHTDLARLMGKSGQPSLFGMYVGRDLADPSKYLLVMGQDGLGMPGREYYLNAEAPYSEHRTAYLTYVQQVLQRAGIADSEALSQSIVDFETRLAKIHWAPEEARDVLKNYHMMGTSQLNMFAPDFDWQVFFESSGYDKVDELLVTTDTAIRDSAALFADTPMPVLRAYTAFHLLNNYAPYLSEDWAELSFDFYQRRLQGIDAPRPMDKRALEFVNDQLGEQLGKLYVQRNFPASSKQKMEELVSYLKRSFRERLTANTWMDDATRARALEKLAAFTAKIGYPDHWQDFSSIAISETDIIENIRQIEEWHHQDNLKMLDEPAREWEWGMSPQTVNAYYSPTRNEIVFPAAILQAPFFDPDADMAVNFGGIGMVIGHELGHGFDDQGSRYTGEGKLQNWWDETSRKNFEVRTSALVEQFNRFEPLDGLHVNGQLTLGENIGDLGGISVAYNAMQLYKKDHDQEVADNLSGYSPEQRFFLAYGQIWRNLITDNRLRQQVLTDPHSPAEYRVNGIVRNFDPWYQAFGVKDGDTLYLSPDQRINIW